MRELKITEISNGFILAFDVQLTDEIMELEQIVVEDTGDEKELFKRMLEKVAEYFGYEYNKWKSENLNITFDKPGHKI